MIFSAITDDEKWMTDDWHPEARLKELENIAHSIEGRTEYLTTPGDIKRLVKMASDARLLEAEVDRLADDLGVDLVDLKCYQAADSTP